VTIHPTPKGTLFAEPLARTTDPSTSHEAAAAAKNTAATHGAIVLLCITDKPGRTASEIAAITGLDRHAVNRRTADLERRLGLIRRGDPRKGTGERKELTWWPVEAGTEGA